MEVQYRQGWSDRLLHLQAVGAQEAGMTDQQIPGELWPPSSGLPSRDRMKPAESLRWGETPFDDLSRAELLRLVQAYHLALVSIDGALRQVCGREPTSPFWEADSQGGRALARADTLKALVDGDSAEARAHIDRQFYRAAAGLLFPSLADPFHDWGVNRQGEWCAPNPGPDWGYRPVEWQDLLPESGKPR
jgi:hypothetical protein